MTADIFIIAISVVAIAISAFAIWYMVRSINRSRRRGVGYWVIAGLATLLAYPLSFGPACWVEVRRDGPPAMIPTSNVYYPIIWLANRSPRIGGIMSWYANLGASEGSSVSFAGDELSCWLQLSGPGSMMPYRTVISCTFGDFADDAEDADGETPEGEVADGRTELQ
jgi:hypothetical protein